MTDTVDAPSQDDAPARPRTSRPFGLDRHYPDLRTHDLAIVGLLLLVLTVQVPIFFAWWHTPRLVVLTASLPIGLYVWWTLLRERDRGAVIAAASLGWVLVASFLSDQTVISLKGNIASDGTALILGGAFAVWALARRLSADGVRLFVVAALVGFGLHAVIAILQHLLQLDNGMFALLAGRSTGFTSNPVYLGGLMAAAFTLSAHLLETATRRTWPIVGMSTFALALGLSGSRVALAAAIVTGGVACWRLRRDVSRALWIPATLAGGQLLSVAITAVFGDGRSSAERLGESSSGAGRLDHWIAGWEAFLDRPIAGYGPTRFRAAVQGRVDVDYFLAAGADADVFFDAHNIVVDTIVSLGLVGGVLLTAFAAWTIRRARGPLAWAALAVGITWLLQPASILTTSVVMLFLGAATRPLEGEPDVRSAERIAGPATSGGLIAIGLALAAPIAFADIELERAWARNDADAIASVGGFYERDPVVMNLAVKIMFPEAADDPAREEQFFELIDRAIEAEDDRPLWWTEKSGYSGFFKRLDDVEPSARRALELQPTDARAWSILLRFARDTGDTALEVEALEALCALGDDEICEQGVTGE